MQYNKALRSPRSRNPGLSVAEISSAQVSAMHPSRLRERFLSEQISLEETFPGTNSSERSVVSNEKPARFQKEVESFSFFVPRIPTSRRKFFIIESTPLSLLVVYQLSGAEGATFTWQQNHPNHAKLRLQVKKQASRPQLSRPSAPRAICGRHKAGESRKLIRKSMI